MKIQALAVAAATLAFAAPAHAGYTPATVKAGNMICFYMQQGMGSKDAIRQTVRNLYPSRANTRGSYTVGRYVMNNCRTSALAAAARDEGRLPSSPAYTGGNTTISEDPFEF